METGAQEFRLLVDRVVFFFSAGWIQYTPPTYQWRIARKNLFGYTVNFFNARVAASKDDGALLLLTGPIIETLLLARGVLAQGTRLSK